MFTEEELYSLLEEAFEEGYNSAIDELEEVMNESEDSSYDLEDEMDSYAEADEYEYEDSEYPELFNEARNDTMWDKFRKGVYRGVGAYSKSFYNKDTPEDKEKMNAMKNAGAAFLAATGRMKPKHAINAAVRKGERATRFMDDIDPNKPVASYKKVAGTGPIKGIKDIGKGAYNRLKELKKYSLEMMKDKNKAMANHGKVMDAAMKIKNRGDKYNAMVDNLTNRMDKHNKLGERAVRVARRKFRHLMSNKPEKD